MQGSQGFVWTKFKDIKVHFKDKTSEFKDFFLNLLMCKLNVLLIFLLLL